MRYSHNTIAYHGTPHEFSEFSTSKIGTGEGAQAYGWGIYFSEKQAVTDEYAITLRKLTLDGKAINPKLFRLIPDSAFVDAANKYKYPDYPEELVIQLIKKSLIYYSNTKDALAWLETWSATGLGALKRVAYERMKELVAEGRIKTVSFIYTVDIPDKSELLDHDNVRQPEKVEKALKSNKVEIEKYYDVAPMPLRKWFRMLVTQGKTWNSYVTPKNVSKLDGRQLYQLVLSDLTREFNDAKEASAIFRAAGIPGMMYWDQLSRAGAGNQTHNFVIWDERKIKVIEKKRVE